MTERVGGSAEPVAPPDNGRWSDERLRGARHQDVLELFKQLVWRVARGGQQRDEVERFHYELLRRMALARAPQGDPSSTPNFAPSSSSLVVGPEHRAANEASFKQSGLDWCAHQMAYNWPRNRFGSLLTLGEYDALLVRVPAPQGDAAPNHPFYDALEALADEANALPVDAAPGAFQDLLFRFVRCVDSARGGASSSGSAPTVLPSLAGYPCPKCSSTIGGAHDVDCPLAKPLVLAAGSCPPAPSPTEPSEAAIVDAMKCTVSAAADGELHITSRNRRTVVRDILQAAYRVDRGSPRPTGESGAAAGREANPNLAK